MIRIKDIPVNDRPCERLIMSGAESLSNEELIAIIFKTGTNGMSAKDLAAYLLSSIGGLNSLNTINYKLLSGIKGIGMSKACNLLASIELGKRLNVEISTINNIKFNNPEVISKYYLNKLKYKKQEYFYAMYLDNNKKIISDKQLFVGTLNYSLVHPREIFKEAYLLSASSIVVLHNHPSGNITPSKQDCDITNNLINVGKLLGISVIDHIIIGNNSYYSFRQNSNIIF